jgi:hypothetical protein
MSANKALLSIGLVFVFACIFLFVAGAFFPRMIGFLDRVVCPDGMQLGNQVEQYTNETGSPGDAVNMVCVGAEGQTPVDATPRMLLILFGLAIAAGVFIVWSFGGVKRVNEQV